MIKSLILKKIFCVFLCFFLLFSMFTFQQAECYAFFPAIALTPAAIEALAGVVYASGLTYVTYTQISDTVKWWYSSSTQDVRSKIINNVNNATTGIMSVTDDVWTSAKNFLRSKFSSGTNTVVANYQIYEGLPYSYNAIDYTSYLLSDCINIGSDTWYFVKVYEPAAYTRYYLYKNGYRVTSSLSFITEFDCYDKMPPQFYLNLATNGQMYLQARYTDNASGHITHLQFVSLANNVPLPAPKTINASFDNTIASVPDYDFKTDGRRDVKVLPLADYIGKTITDIQNPTLTLPTTPPTGATTVPTESTMSASDKTWWESLIGTTGTTISDSITGVKTKVNDIYNFFDAPLAVTPESLTATMQDKVPINPLKISLSRIQNIDTAKSSPPVIRINLHSIFTASTSRFNSPENPFANQDSVFFDFGTLEVYRIASYSLVDYFRVLIGTGFIYTTVLYVWRRIVPSEVIL